jgi:hypothetical protein
MFTGNLPSSTLHSLQGVLSIPEILWELFLGVYCTVWGFRPDAPILSREPPMTTQPDPTSHTQMSRPGSAALG